MAIATYLSLITLCVNGLYAPIKDMGWLMDKKTRLIWISGSNSLFLYFNCYCRDSSVNFSLQGHIIWPSSYIIPLTYSIRTFHNIFPFLSSSFFFFFLPLCSCCCVVYFYMCYEPYSTGFFFVFSQLHFEEILIEETNLYSFV